MNHFVPIPFFIVAIIIYNVCNHMNFKLGKTIAMIIIVLSVIVFAYFYAKYLGYDVLELVKNII